MAVTPVSVPNVFTPSTIADSGQVNADFTALLNAFNNGTMGISATVDGYLYLPGGILIQWAKITGVTADATVVSNPAWPTAFPTNLYGVFTGISNNQSSNPYQLSVSTWSETLTHCDLTVSGGPPGSTCTIWLFAIGN